MLDELADDCRVLGIKRLFILAPTIGPLCNKVDPRIPKVLIARIARAVLAHCISTCVKTAYMWVYVMLHANAHRACYAPKIDLSAARAHTLLLHCPLFLIYWYFTCPRLAKKVSPRL